jgi:hypothetical protein
VEPAQAAELLPLAPTCQARDGSGAAQGGEAAAAAGFAKGLLRSGPSFAALLPTLWVALARLCAACGERSCAAEWTGQRVSMGGPAARATAGSPVNAHNSVGGFAVSPSVRPWSATELCACACAARAVPLAPAQASTCCTALRRASLRRSAEPWAWALPTSWGGWARRPRPCWASRCRSEGRRAGR